MSKQNLLKIALDFLEMTFIGAAVFLLIYIFVCQLLQVSGDSMYPTLSDGEQIVAEKVSIKTSSIQRGQIVVFKHPLNPSRLLIKRVIAVPNDTILIKENKIYVNQEVISEPYLQGNILTKGGRMVIDGLGYKVPENSYFLMGDNREKSSDSRDFGAVPIDSIIGKAFMVYYPLNHLKIIKGN